MAVCSWIRSEHQSVFPGSLLQLIEHKPRLHTREFFLRVDLNNPVHVFREIDDYRSVAALPRQAGAPATGRDWCSEFSAGSYGLDDIRAIPRNDYADRDLPVI